MEKQDVAASSSLNTLHPFIDKEGLLRVGGRLQQSMLPYQAMHQMILPSNHHFTKLVVSADYLRLHHAGPQLLITSLRQNYWIPRIRNLVKTVVHQYQTCCRFKAKQHNSSWVSCHQYECNLPGHSLLQAWIMLNYYHTDWEHHVAKW